jgi:hypothetical protein
MTSNKLSQIGKIINYEAWIPGAKVYYYKPPSAQEVLERGRKAKHLDHYTGPATVLRVIGTRSFVLQYTDVKWVNLHWSLKLSPIEEGENVIIKDTKEAKT